MSAAHILVVDDEPDIRSLLQEILEDEGFSVRVAENAAQAREARRERRPELVLLDIWMPDTDGITLLKEWTENNEIDMPVVMMSGHGTVETAVEATRLGAYDFIEKPLSIAKLLLTIQRALENESLQRENKVLRQGLIPIGDLIGVSAAMEKLKINAKRVAGHSTAVLITGDSGTGKEVVARYLHDQSPRADGPFISVGVAGLARENPDAELFGIEQDGKITYGSLEQSNGGTLFLKDIADMDQSTQARLLSALESNSLLRVGGREAVEISVRVIAATSKNLAQEVADGNFREDLFYHLNVLPLSIPPLRERNEDIDSLTTHYLEYFVQQEGLKPRDLTVGAKTRLRDYEWPGNVRELKNLIQRLLILGSEDAISVSEVSNALGIRPEALGGDSLPGFDLPLREAREKFEKAYLEFQLRALGGSVSKVAERVGIERTHLYRKLRSLEIDPKQIKESGS
ncbi:MAG: sigma-54 dependent transcriptional regulator [Pseudomonadota bacterium]